MGIVNVTPDSFSDGGQFSETQAAVEHALQLVAEGADIIDIGGESTRPRATPVSAEEELRRVIPVLEQLAGKIKIPISIDTTKPEVAESAVTHGASIVNDIAAGRENDAMCRLIAETGAGYVCMHMQGSPESMQQCPVYKDVVAEINSFFGAKLSSLRDRGVQSEQIIFDVGIGFGKTVEHNLTLLQNLRSFREWGRPLLLGVSRKSFIGKLLGSELGDRSPGSIASACWAVQNGVQLIRTHDVAATRQAVRMTEILVQKTGGTWKKPGN